jgi:phosphohistidine phosphatase SixA
MNSFLRPIRTAHRRSLRLASLAAVLASFCVGVCPGDAGAAGQNESEVALEGLAAVLPQLRGGGYVIYFRHGATDDAGRSDYEADLARCDTQRNLSAQGRAQAEQIGRALHALGVPVGPVISSPYCRCKETASLAFGRFQIDPDLYFEFNASPQERKRLADVLRHLLATRTPAGVNAVIIAHSANLREAAGIWPKPEAVAYVFLPLGNGRFKAVAKVLPGEWQSVASAKR